MTGTRMTLVGFGCGRHSVTGVLVCLGIVMDFVLRSWLPWSLIYWIWPQEEANSPQLVNGVRVKRADSSTDCRLRSSRETSSREATRVDC